MNSIDLPRIETVPKGWGEPLATPEEYVARVTQTEIPNLRAQMSRGELPGFIIDRRIVGYLFGPSFFHDIDTNRSGGGSITRCEVSPSVQRCFDAVDRVFGSTHSGRILNVIETHLRPTQFGKSRDGQTHCDGFLGTTVHVQQKTHYGRPRSITMGLMTGPFEDMPGYTEFDSVQDAITDPRIWEGYTRRGDITAIGSGYLPSDHTYVRAVHQLQTTVNREPPEGVVTAKFTQFIEATEGDV